MNNKRGFTLVELMGVLVIMAVILAIAVPTFFKIRDNINGKNDENIKELIKEAATKYTEDSNITAFYVNDLIKQGYLEEKDIKDSYLWDIIKVSYDNGLLYAKIYENNEEDNTTLNKYKDKVRILIFKDDGTQVTATTNFWSNTDVVLKIELNGIEIQSFEWYQGSTKIDNSSQELPVKINNDTSLSEIYTIKIIATDGVSYEGQTRVKIDKKIPEFYSNSIISPSNESWSPSKKYSVNAYDFESGLKGYIKYDDPNAECSKNKSDYISDKSFTFNETFSSKTIKICIMDNVGNINEVQTIIKNVDSSEPTISFNPNNNSTYAKEQSTTISATDSDSGINNDSLKYTISSNNSSKPTFDKSFSNNQKVVLNNLTGRYYVWATASDNAGNETSKVSGGFLLDNTKPTCAISGMPTGWVRSATLYVLGSDAHSGLHATPYSWNNSNYKSDNSNYITANNTYYASVRDAAGNIQSCSATVTKIDNTPPTVSFNSNGNTTYKKAQSTIVSVADSQSGVNQNSLRYLWSQSTNTQSESSINQTFTNYNNISKSNGTGIWYLWILAKDNVGNTAITRSNAFYLDNTAPICGSKVNEPTSWANANRTIGIYCSDGNSGCSQGYYASSFSSESATSYIQISDNAGNRANCSVNTYIDRTAPSCSGSNNEGSDNNWRNSDQTITVYCSDNLSGCSQGSFSRYYSDEIRTSSIQIRDRAGNTRDCGVGVYIDKTPPSIYCSDLSTQREVYQDEATRNICSAVNPILPYYRKCSYTDYGSGLKSRYISWGGAIEVQTHGQWNNVNVSTNGSSFTDTLCQNSASYEASGVVGTVCDRANNCKSFNGAGNF